MAEDMLFMIEQHERLRVPQGWTGQDRALIAQLERVHDDIYKHFGRIGLSDLSQDVRTLLSPVAKTHDGLCPMLPNETGTTKYLRQDGSWSAPPGDIQIRRLPTRSSMRSCRLLLSAAFRSTAR